MSECNSFEEYREKFNANQRLSGFGLETTMHVPCPFCAESDFLVHRIVDSFGAYRTGVVCTHCQRGARGLVRQDRGGVSCEFVQTCGPEQPAWLPRMHVVESE